MVAGKLSVGNVEILGITDIEVDFFMPLTQIFPDVPLESWAPYQQRFEGHFRGADTWCPRFSRGPRVSSQNGKGKCAWRVPFGLTVASTARSNAMGS